MLESLLQTVKGRRFCLLQMLTNADKGGRGLKKVLTTANVDVYRKNTKKIFQNKSRTKNIVFEREGWIGKC